MSFSDRLKALLEENSISVPELSRRSGVNKNTIYSYLRRGTKKPDPAVLQDIAEVLGTDVYYLLGVGTENPGRNDEENDLWELREALRRRPEMRTLFSLTKNATASEIRQAISVIEALKNANAQEESE